LALLCSYITTDELEQALKDHNMGDHGTIKDIIDEVDIDNVSEKSLRMMMWVLPIR
jgi:hypothetical protein